MKIHMVGSPLKWVFLLFLFISIRVDAESQPSWGNAVSAGGSGTDWANSIQTDKKGYPYVTGYFSSSVKFGGKVFQSVGGTDAFFAKFSRNGKLQWLVQIGGSGEDSGTDLAFDAAGNIYVTGWFTDSATFASIHGSARTVTGYKETIFLAKYSSSGSLQWIQTGISVSPEFVINRGHSVTVDSSSGFVYLTGVGQMDTVFSSAGGNDHTVPGPSTWHVFLAKYSGDGIFQWGQYNQASPNSIPHKVAVDAGHHVYITGWFEGAVIFFSNDGRNFSITGLSGQVQTYPDYPGDAFIAKYDADGNVKWVNQVGGYKAIGTDLAASWDGKISMTGFIGNIDYGAQSQADTIVTSQSGGMDIHLGGGSFTNPYNKDAFVATFNTEGVLEKAVRWGGSLDDGGSGIIYDQDSNLYLSGVFQGTANFDGRILTGGKPNNLFVIKYAGNSLAWIMNADGAGTTPSEGNPRLCLASKGSLFISGAFLDNASFGKTSLNSFGAEDIFLAELSNSQSNSKN